MSVQLLIGRFDNLRRTVGSGETEYIDINHFGRPYPLTLNQIPLFH